MKWTIAALTITSAVLLAGCTAIDSEEQIVGTGTMSLAPAETDVPAADRTDNGESSVYAEQAIGGWEDQINDPGEIDPYWCAKALEVMATTGAKDSDVVLEAFMDQNLLDNLQMNDLANVIKSARAAVTGHC
ncbi:hypothetical protein RHOER0001_5298 [Rhodococcus erythropolis SK121]|nr:hypothetical protein [Rhodococcus qingshengii]EEN87725.1 hypothetical protein RHOER0001_5298 [Rhodococcus erythropolis SK121]